MNTPADTRVTAALAEAIAATPFAAIPETFKDALKLSLMDTVGCVAYGVTTEANVLLRQFAISQGGGVDEAFVWGCQGRQKTALSTAVIANGAAVHSFDFDDHSRAKIHPGAVVFPTAIALANACPVSYETFVRAVALGYEVMNRISLASDPGAARTRGWHLTGTTGTFASATTAAVLLGLDATQTAWALGIAGTQSSGLWAFNADAAMTKRFHPGMAARNGITAALLARQGFNGGTHILEADDGGFLSVMSDQNDPSRVLRDWGSQWHGARISLKPYSACGSNHAAIEAALLLRDQHQLAPEAIARIEIGVAKVVLLQTGFEYHNEGVLHAQMSIRYNVAAALAEGDVNVEQFRPEALDDATINQLIGLCEVYIAPEIDRQYPARYGGEVRITTQQGQVFEKRIDYSKGMPENPMDDDDVSRKVRTLVHASRLAWVPDTLGEQVAQAWDEADLARLLATWCAI